MLFAQHAQQLQSGIASIQTRIDELEALLKSLRSDKSQLEAELQTILTLEGAAESALNQAQSFISAADSLGRSDLINTFWTALDAMRNSEMPQLPASEPEPEAETTPEPTPPDTDGEPTSDVIDVTPESFRIIPAEINRQVSKPVDIATAKPSKSTVGSAALDVNTASLDVIKTYVRGIQDDDITRKYGKLTLKSTWLKAYDALTNQ